MALGVHGMSALTAITAQNTVEVSGVHEIPAEFVVEQIDAVATDIGVDAAKTGMLASASIVEAVAGALSAHNIDRLVVDPVFISQHRDRLLAEDAVDAMKRSLLPLATVLTPNLFEAEALTGRDIADIGAMEEAARRLSDMGPRSVLVKGGHLEGDEAVDVFYDGREITHLRGPRFDTDDTHGTGCSLSAAITARLAQGDDVAEAVAFAKDFISSAIERGLRIGKGYGPVNPAWKVWDQIDP
jgi:hydroxymethylpyrimidine/phosphomethylpyrimidine kinase